MEENNAMQLVEPITMTALVAAEIFTGPQGVEKILSDIKAEIAKFVPDVSTEKGRKAIASMSRKCSTSKVMVDDLGKNLVAEWKKQSALVDASRKMFRDEMDALRDSTRKPLDEWEAEVLAKHEAEKAQQAMNEAHDAALIEDAMRTQAKEIEALKAAAAKVEADRLAAEAAALAEKEAQEAAARAEQERIENEARIRKEAEERAKAEAEAAAAALIAEAERKEREAKEAVERAEREAREAAEKAERDRIAAAERAEQEKAAAIRAEQERAAAEALRIENERKAAEAAAEAKAAAERAEAELRAANTRHQAAVNNKAVAALVALGLSEGDAKTVIVGIAKGLVPAVTINY
jgi:colicin import membrane protein